MPTACCRSRPRDRTTAVSRGVSIQGLAPTSVRKRSAALLRRPTLKRRRIAASAPRWDRIINRAQTLVPRPSVAVAGRAALELGPYGARAANRRACASLPCVMCRPCSAKTIRWNWTLAVSRLQECPLWPQTVALLTERKLRIHGASQGIKNTLGCQL